MKTKRVFLTFASILLLLIVASGSSLPASAEGQNGTTLTADVTATATWTKTYNWTLAKSVSPDTWDLFRGDSGTSLYTITVTKDNGTEEAYITGEVCVTNGGGVATQDLAIEMEIRDGYEPPNDFLFSQPLSLGTKTVLEPGETYCYPYQVDIPFNNNIEYPQPHPGGTYKVVANVTILNHSGHLDTHFGPSPETTTVMPNSPVLVDDSVSVNDTNGQSWNFNDSGSVTYTKSFNCDTDQGKHTNIAQIGKDGPTASAEVYVNCYDLTVTKTAETSYNRDYDWTIEKSADQTDLILSVGETYDVNYMVTVDATSTDSDWMATGMITVTNDAPIDAVLNSVTDVVSTDIDADVDCGVTFPYTLASGDELVCSYEIGLPNADARTNTATATLQNYAYDEEMDATENGTTDFSGTADVVFGEPKNVTDECIDVTDSLGGTLGKVCAGDKDGLPKVFEYKYTIGPYETCGTYEVKNTANFMTNDSETKGEAYWTVKVNVPCTGCTLTQGYWKTHSSYGPAPYDDTWALVLPDGEDTIFHLSEQSFYNVLWTAPKKGNAYYILAHQYIAAYLNGLNGAYVPTEITTAMAEAKAFFETAKPDDKLSTSQRQDLLKLADLLDQYNSGMIGPGHCSEVGFTGYVPFWAKYGNNLIFLPFVKQ